MNENQRVVQNAFHLFRVRHEIRGEVTFVELHAFDNIHCCVYGFGFFDSDRAVFADFVHGVGDDVTDDVVGIGGDRRDLRDLLAGVNIGLHGGEFIDNCTDSFVDTTLQAHRVGTGSHILQSFAENGFGEDGSGSGTITGVIICLGSDFLDHLCTHVF